MEFLRRERIVRRKVIIVNQVFRAKLISFQIGEPPEQRSDGYIELAVSKATKQREMSAFLAEKQNDDADSKSDLKRSSEE